MNQDLITIGKRAQIAANKLALMNTATKNKALLQLADDLIKNKKEQEYEKFYKTMDKSLNSLIQLKQLGQYVSYFIEGNVSPEFLCALYKSQLSNQTQENFLSTDRYYIKLVKKIIAEGQKKGEIRDDIPVDKLAHHVLVIERGIFVDWCVQAGSFSLGYFGAQSFEFYSEFMKPHNKTQ